MMNHKTTWYFNKSTKLLKSLLFIQAQSQNGNLKDCQIKKIEPTLNHGLSPKLVWINNLRIRLRFKQSYLKQDLLQDLLLLQII